MNRYYRFGELKAQLKESANEFKPVYGNGVKGEKESNTKAVKEILADTEKVYSDLKQRDKANKNTQVVVTRNGMNDLQYDAADDTFKKNAEAGLKGFTSAEDEKNHGKDALGNASRNDDKFAKQFTDSAKNKKKEQDADSEAGLKSRELPKDDVHRKSTVVGEDKKIPLLRFKKVQFISESQMLAHVPDDYKNEGRRFFMEDHKGNKYLVEWHNKPSVEKRLNESKTNAEMDRIKYLFGYSSKENGTTNSIRMNENKEIDDMLGRVRKLMK